MKNVLWILMTVFLLMSCSHEPKWADEEEHDKTEQLFQKYGKLIIGTWHYERTSEKHRFFEKLTFMADGTLTGSRKWQMRELVTVDGKETYTDWEDLDMGNGTFSGHWSLGWQRSENPADGNYLSLVAGFDEPESPYMAYSSRNRFDSVDEKRLRFKNNDLFNRDDWTDYTRGDATPSF